MAFITANTLITSISLFHITIAYFLITNPRTISDQVFVYILGESMTMVRPKRVYHSGYTANIPIL